MKKWLAIILGLVILAFIFADSLFYLAGWWRERTGKAKEAVETYRRLIERYPRSRWVDRAKEAVERLEKSREERKRGETEVGEPVTPYTGVLKKAKERVKEIEEKKGEEYEKWLKEIGK